MLDAALEGFRLTRERPAAVAVWAVLILLMNLVTLGGLVALGLGPALADPNPFAPSPSPETLEAVRRGGVWLPMLALTQVGGGAVLYAAVMRAVTEPGAHRFAYLRLGAQELRQAVLWCVGLLLLSAYALFLVTAYEAFAAADGTGGRLGAAAAAVGVFLALFYPVVRLSLAPAATFVERRIVLFGAWPLSRGVFWRLVGCYVVAALLAAAVWLLATVVIATALDVLARTAGVGAGLEHALDSVEVGSLQGLLGPAALGAQAVRALLAALALAIVAAPAPVLLAALRGAPPPR